MKAFETEIEFSGMKGSGIVVEFGKSWTLKFWKQAYYIPCWDLKSVWLTNEWLETGSAENGHCYEPMMDRECKYSYVKVEESSPVRTKVRWHYTLCDNQYRIFNGNTCADEYYITYPDGLTIRKLVGWPGNESDFGGNPTLWEVGEWIVVNPKGTTPEQNLDDPVMRFGNLSRGEICLWWPSKYPQTTPLCKEYPEITRWGEYIGQVLLKDAPSPFAIIPNNNILFPHESCLGCGKDHVQFNVFPGNVTDMHWPGYDKDDFVGWKRAESEVGKRVTCTSLMSYGYSYGAVRSVVDAESIYFPQDLIRMCRPHRPTVWISLIGVTDRPFSYIRKIAASWLSPAKVRARTGIFDGYAYSERCYVIRKLTDDKMVEFRLEPVAAVINPVFKIENWGEGKPKVYFDNHPLDEQTYVSHTSDGSKVIWIDRVVNRPTDVKITA